MSDDRIQKIWSHSVVRKAVEHLAAGSGKRLYLVGGALRDVLVGRPTDDWDLSLRDAGEFARQVAEEFDATLVMLDEDKPTARVVVKTGNEADRQILDFGELRGSDITDDLAKRDFTVNAMAWPVGEAGEVIDPYGGRRDLEDGKVRALSREALADDPVRMLRAFRIAAHLNGIIEPQTLKWISTEAERLTESASERIGAELLALLAAAECCGELREMDGAGLLEQVIPDGSCTTMNSFRTM